MSIYNELTIYIELIMTELIQFNIKNPAFYKLGPSIICNFDITLDDDREIRDCLLIRYTKMNDNIYNIRFSYNTTYKYQIRKIKHNDCVFVIIKPLGKYGDMISTGLYYFINNKYDNYFYIKTDFDDDLSLEFNYVFHINNYYIPNCFHCYKLNYNGNIIQIKQNKYIINNYDIFYNIRSLAYKLFILFYFGRGGLIYN